MNDASAMACGDAFTQGNLMDEHFNAHCRLCVARYAAD